MVEWKLSFYHLLRNRFLCKKLSRWCFQIRMDIRRSFWFVEWVASFVSFSHSVDYKHYEEYGTKQSNDSSSYNSCKYFIIYLTKRLKKNHLLKCQVEQKSLYPDWNVYVGHPILLDPPELRIVNGILKKRIGAKILK